MNIHKNASLTPKGREPSPMAARARPRWPDRFITIRGRTLEHYSKVCVLQMDVASSAPDGNKRELVRISPTCLCLVSNDSRYGRLNALREQQLNALCEPNDSRLKARLRPSTSYTGISI